MFPCSLCEEAFASVDELGQHLEFYHQRMSSDSFLCVFCQRTIKLMFSFKNHLVTKHQDHHEEWERRQAQINNNVNPNVQNDNANVDNDDNANVDNDNANFEINDNANFENDDNANDGNNIVNIDDDDRFTLQHFIDNLYKNVELYVAQLYALPSASRKLVDNIITGTSELMTSSVIALKENVFRLLAACENVPQNFADEVEKLQNMFSTLADPFEFMKSEHCRLHSFMERGFYIPPTSVEIGSAEKFVNNNDGPPPLDRVPVTVQVIPLRRVFKAFLEHPGIFAHITGYLNELENSDKVHNFVQGDLWKEMSAPFKAVGKFVLPLHIEFDDYEPDNPLGSHHNVHSLGSLCASIPCLRPEFVSSLDNFFLLSLFESKHRKTFGNSIIFGASIEELNFLAKEGILVNVNGEVKRVYFLSSLIIGDNAGLNSIQGFIESFRGNFYCRVCRLHRNEMAHTCIPPPANRMRTVGNYAADLLLNDYSQTGIHEICIWNDLEGYNCIQAPNCDIMHDIWSGVLVYDICNILYYFVEVRSYFGIELLKERIDSFDYSPNERGNKPPTSHLTVGRLDSTSWNLSASEWLCLCRCLGGMIGDLVPEGNSVWKLYLLIQEIVEIVCCPVFEDGVDIYLSTLIQEHHHLYIRHFGPLKPKHHFLTHYPFLLKRNGPLMYVSSLMLERSHRRGTLYAKVCNSRVNFPLSVAVKYQLYLCERLMRPQNFVRNVKTSGVSRIQVRMLVNYPAYAELLPLDPDSFVSIANSADVFGTLYCVKMVIVFRLGNLFPVFAKIIRIVVNEDSVFFVVNVLKTDLYIEHIRGYVICASDEFSCVSQKDLIYYAPLWPRSYKTHDVVTLKHML